ncbi:hypothetical protein A33M_4357 [Rhodovulum sp. PH10]|nr:hypothetical protein A33M_4357 [Rhodovulum sp. PH10]
MIDAAPARTDAPRLAPFPTRRRPADPRGPFFVAFRHRVVPTATKFGLIPRAGGTPASRRKRTLRGPRPSIRPRRAPEDAVMVMKRPTSGVGTWAGGNNCSAGRQASRSTEQCIELPRRSIARTGSAPQKFASSTMDKLICSNANGWREPSSRNDMKVGWSAPSAHHDMRSDLSSPRRGSTERNDCTLGYGRNLSTPPRPVPPGKSPSEEPPEAGFPRRSPPRRIPRERVYRKRVFRGRVFRGRALGHQSLEACPSETSRSGTSPPGTSPRNEKRTPELLPTSAIETTRAWSDTRLKQSPRLPGRLTPVRRRRDGASTRRRYAPSRRDDEKPSRRLERDFRPKASTRLHTLLEKRRSADSHSANYFAGWLYACWAIDMWL